MVGNRGLVGWLVVFCVAAVVIDVSSARADGLGAYLQTDDIVILGPAGVLLRVDPVDLTQDTIVSPGLFAPGGPTANQKPTDLALEGRDTIFLASYYSDGSSYVNGVFKADVVTGAVELFASPFMVPTIRPIWEIEVAPNGDLIAIAGGAEPYKIYQIDRDDLSETVIYAPANGEQIERLEVAANGDIFVSQLGETTRSVLRIPAGADRPVANPQLVAEGGDLPAPGTWPGFNLELDPATGELVFLNPDTVPGGPTFPTEAGIYRMDPDDPVQTLVTFFEPYIYLYDLELERTGTYIVAGWDGIFRVDTEGTKTPLGIAVGLASAIGGHLAVARPRCSNGIDDDRDGKADYSSIPGQGDPDCTGPDDDTETKPCASSVVGGPLRVQHWLAALFGLFLLRRRQC